jgi:hypothetical protein
MKLGERLTHHLCYEQSLRVAKIVQIVADVVVSVRCFHVHVARLLAVY